VPVELARIGGIVAAAGLGVLILARPRTARLAGLVVWAAGGASLLYYLEPVTGLARLAAAGVGLAVVGVGLAALFLRWPWLVALGALALAPARIPIDLGGEEVKLLVPLYVVVVGAAFAFAWELWRGDARSRELGLLAWPVAALVGWFGLSIAWAIDVNKAAVTLVAFYLPFGLLAQVVARLPWSRRWAGALAVQFAVMAVVLAGVGTYQWLTRDIFWNPGVRIRNAYAPFYRVNSVFWDPSVYGRFLVLALLALVVVVVFDGSRRIVLASLGAIAAIWTGLLFSFSQSSFGALIAGVLALAVVLWGSRALVPLGLIVVLLLSVGFAAPSVRSAVRKDLDRATSGRSGLVENGIRIAAEHPVWGLGIGGFRRAYADRAGLRGDDPKHAASHTTPVTVVAETGIVGLALFGWLLAVALATGFRRASGSFAGRASLIVALVVLAICVHSLFYAAFFEDPMTWGALGLGALVASSRGER